MMLPYFDWGIRRNYERRRELYEQSKQMLEQREKEIDELDTSSMTDDEIDEALDALDDKYDTLPIWRQIRALEYKETRNDWFKSFVKSFGLCDSRRITRKQGEIFAKYSEPNHERESGRGNTYFVRVDDLFVECVLFSAREPAYVTIRKLF